jgi:predicted NAD-dependent protein-ADP-ribosyltransferase YbiA (DUF1768 family)
LAAISYRIRASDVANAVAFVAVAHFVETGLYVLCFVQFSLVLEKRLRLEQQSFILIFMSTVFFEDHEVAKEVLAAKRPVHIKALGRKVAGFNDDKWNRVCRKIVKTGNIAKVCCTSVFV